MGKADIDCLVAKKLWCGGELQLQSTRHSKGLVEAAQVVDARLNLEGLVFWYSDARIRRHRSSECRDHQITWPKLS
jgi:hypothetical protein